MEEKVYRRGVWRGGGLEHPILHSSLFLLPFFASRERGKEEQQQRKATSAHPLGSLEPANWPGPCRAKQTDSVSWKGEFGVVLRATLPCQPGVCRSLAERVAPSLVLKPDLSTPAKTLAMLPLK